MNWMVYKCKIHFSDIDECHENIDGCSQLCSNTVGSYTCGCRDGYRLASDGHTCNGMYCCILTVIGLTSQLNHADINECAEEIDRCAQNCQNTIGSYTCSCNSGYRLGSNGYSCNGIIQNSGGTLIHNYVLLSFHKTLMNVLRTLMDVHRRVQTL